MRRSFVAVSVCGAVLALLRPTHTLASTAPCPRCVAGPPIVSANSIVVVAPFGATNPVLSGAVECLLEYRLGDPKLHSVWMSKSSTAFSGSIVGVPAATAVQYRMLCDGAAGPFVSAKTQPTAGTPPKVPAIIAVKRIDPQKLSFSLESDPTEPTVFWVETRPTSPPNAEWDVAPDMVDTFTTKRITVTMAAPLVRLGIRNSAGTSYSPITP